MTPTPDEDPIGIFIVGLLFILVIGVGLKLVGSL